MLSIRDDIPPHLRIGLFANGGTFNCWVRFSNQHNEVQSDTLRDVRGMAIKILNVPGEKIEQDPDGFDSQDLVLISHNRFIAEHVGEFAELLRANMKGVLGLLWYVVNPFNSHWYMALRLWRSMQKHSRLFDIEWNSATPFALGSNAVKYIIRRQGDCGKSGGKWEKDVNHLRRSMQSTLSETSVSFDVLVQLQKDPVSMPIEDPTVAWSQMESAPIPVATLTLPIQDFDNSERDEIGEKLSFNIWHSLDCHRPLGGINRARRHVYQVISEMRAKRRRGEG
jgi:hypothetical protein